MKKLVIMGLGVFLLSLGGTTGTLVALGRSNVPAATATAEDATNTAVDTAAHATHAAAVKTGHGGGASALAAAEPGGPPPSSAEPAPVADSLVAPGGQTQEAFPPRPTEPGKTAVADSRGADRERESYRQLARIFANMKTADAAKVLGFMSDTEVQGVIEQLGVRQAAGLLSALPKERAAALSRRLLQIGLESGATP